MRTKEEAAKLLLDNGWTLEEVNEVLGEKKEPLEFHYHYPPTGFVRVYPYWPTVPPQPVYRDYKITCNTSHWDDSKNGELKTAIEEAFSQLHLYGS